MTVNPSYRRLTVNLTVRAHRAQRNGREYLVAPMTLINPGVLSGSKGPLFYPPEEIRRNARDWNGVPITVYHPHHLGQPVSAGHPGIIKRQGVGTVRNVTANGKLRAEGWFDVQKLRKVNPGIYNRLTSGDPIELSTGLFTDNEERVGSFRGRQYTAIARNYRPDHLAVLPDQTGACSIADGCGVLVNRRNKLNGIGSTLTTKLRQLVGNEDQPSDDIRPEKACKILEDGTAQGQPLTEDQKKMFGAACGKRTTNRMLANKLSALVGNWGGPPNGQEVAQAAAGAGPASPEVTQPAEDPAMWLAKRVMLLAKQYVGMIQGGQMPQGAAPPPDPSTSAPPDADADVGDDQDQDWPPDDDQGDDSNTEDQNTDDDGNSDEDDDSGKPPWVGNRLHRKLSMLVNDDQSDQSSEATIISGPRAGSKLQTVFEKNADEKELWGTDAAEREAIESHEDDEKNCSMSKNCSVHNVWTDASREAASASKKALAQAQSHKETRYGKHAVTKAEGASKYANKASEFASTGSYSGDHREAAFRHGLAAEAHDRAASHYVGESEPIRALHEKARDQHLEASAEHKKEYHPDFQSNRAGTIRNKLRGLLGNKDQSFKDKGQKDADEAKMVELETDRPTADHPKDADEAAEAHDLLPSEAESKADEDDFDATDDWDDDTDYTDVAEDENKDTVSNSLHRKLNILSR